MISRTPSITSHVKNYTFTEIQFENPARVIKSKKTSVKKGRRNTSKRCNRNRTDHPQILLSNSIIQEPQQEGKMLKSHGHTVSAISSCYSFMIETAQSRGAPSRWAVPHNISKI